MPTELEAKMQVTDLEPVRQKLKSAGAARIKSELETNTFFDTPGKSLQSGDKGLRIRVAVDEAGHKKCTVTMKGPLQKSQFKSREEIQFVADDADAVRDMFEHLGYRPTLSFEKRRETWKMGDCEVDLDELPLLGKFVEIEAKSEQDISAARQTLGLQDAGLISIGYIALLARLLEQRRIEDRHIRF